MTKYISIYISTIRTHFVQYINSWTKTISIKEYVKLSQAGRLFGLLYTEICGRKEYID